MNLNDRKNSWSILGTPHLTKNSLLFIREFRPYQINLENTITFKGETYITDFIRTGPPDWKKLHILTEFEGEDSIQIKMAGHTLHYVPTNFWDLEKSSLKRWLTDTHMETKQGLDFKMLRVKAGIDITDPDLPKTVDAPLEPIMGPTVDSAIADQADRDELIESLAPIESGTHRTAVPTKRSRVRKSKPINRSRPLRGTQPRRGVPRFNQRRGTGQPSNRRNNRTHNGRGTPPRTPQYTPRGRNRYNSRGNYNRQPNDRQLAQNTNQQAPMPTFIPIPTPMPFSNYQIPPFHFGPSSFGRTFQGF